ncbi:MAG TPA: DUF305 domain-containing protein, partial [Sphingomicrobium sp.]|nr:DUF305 domain-containing protein [Sphingomicrobium sp.]
MLPDRPSRARSLTARLAAIGLLAAAAGAAAQGVPIIQPGAPGQPATTISAEEAIRIADTRYSPDDVRFMQDMIVHHRQAIAMAALVKGRTNRQAIIDVARRIDASQADEMGFMRGWLRERRQAERAPAAPAAHAMHSAGPEGAVHAVPGMATGEQMAELAAAKGTAFDRLFIERMIHHHEGAVKMAEELIKRPGSAYDPVLFDFVNEVINDQKAEIKRMSALVPALVDDPRASLAAGFRDAGQAIRNLELVASLPKPTGFLDPANPSGAPPARPGDKKAAADKKADSDPRSPLLSFANTDMAFAGDLLAVGNYHGFNLYRIESGGAPRLVSSVICPGGQGDLSIVGDLLIMSVEQTRGRVDCGRQGVSEDVSPERFRGLRIFDIRDPLRPVQVGQVQTCRGSHTHSVVSGPDPAGTIIVYVSGTSTVRKEDELAGCVGEVPGDVRTALFRIDVVEIPVADPSRARIVDSPAVFADAQTGSLAGLWRGGHHGEGTQEASRTDECHDITVFPSRSLAAGACSGNGIIFDIADPRKPRRLDAVVDPGFAYWHSATFNNDGTKVLFTDEWGGGSRPRCRVQDPRNWGANAIYDIVENKLRFRSHQKLPAPQTEQENCVAHNGSIVPVPGRDIFVQAWYQGGISIIDFTDSARPVEIAFFDRGPIDGDQLVMGGFWSAYWYRGRIYATEIARGLDVLALKPSEHLSANEIAAAALADHGGRFNPQQQFPVRWPDHPVIALAYVDQLRRSQALPAATL